MLGTITFWKSLIDFLIYKIICGMLHQGNQRYHEQGNLKTGLGHVIEVHAIQCSRDHK